MSNIATPTRLALAAAILAAVHVPAFARDTTTPDWPCVQKKVETISVSQVWDGPPIEGLKGWWEDKALNALIEPLTSRRVELKAAEDLIKTWAGGLPAADRDAKLTLLFAGVFDKLSIQRRGILSGLEKYLRGQRDRAAEIETEGVELGKLEANAAAAPDDTKLAAELTAAQEKYEWASRIFQERQNSIPVACEIPVIVDQRLYELGKLIRAQMSK